MRLLLDFEPLEKQSDLIVAWPHLKDYDDLLNSKKKHDLK